MRTRILSTVGRAALGCGALVFASSLAAAQPLAQEPTAPVRPVLEPVPFGSERWVFDEAQVEHVEHLGRDALHLVQGRIWLRDTHLRNGVLECDIALPRERGYMGVYWRHQENGDYAHFYVRPHQSGNPDACQYTPVFHGLAGWQLYAGPGYNAAVEYAFDRWMRLRVEFWEERARITLDGTPLLVVPDLKMTAREGLVGLQVPGFASAHFSGFRFGRLEQAPFEAPARPSPAPGTVQRWLVSNAFPSARLEGATRLGDAHRKGLTWTGLEADDVGIANLARVQGLSRGDTSFARIVLRSDRERDATLAFGFSDRVKVYFDGRLVYEGDDSYRSRDYRFLGTMGTFDRLTLPLEGGDHEVLFAVTEGFGGWGLVARVDPDVTPDVEVRAE